MSLFGPSKREVKEWAKEERQDHEHTLMLERRRLEAVKEPLQSPPPYTIKDDGLRVYVVVERMGIKVSVEVTRWAPKEVFNIAAIEAARELPPILI